MWSLLLGVGYMLGTSVLITFLLALPPKPSLKVGQAHAEIGDTLILITALSDALGPNAHPTGVLELRSQVATLLRQLERYVRREESSLFFPLDWSTQKNASAPLREQHRLLLASAKKLYALINSERFLAPLVAQSIEDFSRRFTEHCNTEERVLFPVLDKIMLPDRFDAETVEDGERW